MKICHIVQSSAAGVNYLAILSSTAPPYLFISSTTKRKISRKMGSIEQTFDVASARRQFPALNQKQTYLDNAGGSQVLGTVINSYVSAFLVRPSALVNIPPTSIASPTISRRPMSSWAHRIMSLSKPQLVTMQAWRLRQPL